VRSRSKCSEEQEQEQLSAVEEAAQNLLPNPARSPYCNRILNRFILTFFVNVFFPFEADPSVPRVSNLIKIFPISSIIAVQGCLEGARWRSEAAAEDGTHRVRRRLRIVLRRQSKRE
jgi:hypothetical protein